MNTSKAVREFPYSIYTSLKFTLICTLLTLLFVSQPVLAEAPEQTHNQVLSVKIVRAIEQVETNGQCGLKGGSGVRGCCQFQIPTWIGLTLKHFGTTTLPITRENEEKVMDKEVTRLLEDGHTVYDIALKHNSGHFGKCSHGFNKFGVFYDSCAYTKRVIDLIK